MYLKKALELQQSGGNIVCLIDVKWLDNLANEANNTFGIEIDIKRFDEVAVLKLSIPQCLSHSFFKAEIEKANLQKDQHINPAFNELVQNDVIAQAVKHFEIEAAMGVKLLQEFEGMRPYLLSSYDQTRYSNRTLMNLSIRTLDGRNEEATINLFLKNLRYKYWENLFANPKFTKQYTTEMKHQLSDRLEKLVDYDFSYFNIKTIQLEMIQSLRMNLDKVVLEVFDELSAEYAYSSYSKNIHYYNGWKTNKSWFVNKKVIIPFRAYNHILGSFDINEVEQHFNDYEKALNFLNGNKPLEINIRAALEEAKKTGQFKNIEFNFFTVSFYIKGTAWITFKDMDLLKRLNRFAGQKRAWLPSSYGEKNYSDMFQEEKNVIDEFEGEKAYTEMMQKQLCSELENNKQLLL